MLYRQKFVAHLSELPRIGADKCLKQKQDMGLFDIFKNEPLPTDKVFGQLKKLKGTGLTCHPFFSPLQRTIPSLIKTSENLPSDNHRGFYDDLQNNYSDFKKKMTPIIEDTFRNAFPGFKIKDFDKEFLMIGLVIPDFTKKPLSWEIAFDHETEKDHVYTVEFADMNPLHLHIDG